MSTETSSTPTAGNGTTNAAKSKEPQYRMDPAEIPSSIRGQIAEKLGKEADAYPAKDGGNYKGRIVYADDKYIVQSIGKGEKTAVVHDRAEVDIKGASLLSRAANNDLEGRNVQIHYREQDKGAAMYPWNAQKEQAQKEAGREQRQQSASERIIEHAKAYAEGNIKQPKQREAFLEHLGNVLDRASQTRAQAKEQQSQAPAREQQRAEPQQQR